MPAYFIAEHIVTDDAKFLEYVTKARSVMAKHGGMAVPINYCCSASPRLS